MAIPKATANIVVVGAGLAGLFLALKLSPRPVTLISSTPLDDDIRPDGGIAAVLDATDSIDPHVRDTIAAGGVLVDEAVGRLIRSDGPGRVRYLVAYGVPLARG